MKNIEILLLIFTFLWIYGSVLYFLEDIKAAKIFGTKYSRKIIAVGFLGIVLVVVFNKFLK